MDRLFDSPHVGQIVVFHPPTGADSQKCGRPHTASAACDWPASTASSQTYVKRIVAGPGDLIMIDNGHVIRNGRPEPDSYTRRCAPNQPDCSFTTPIHIPRACGSRWATTEAIPTTAASGGPSQPNGSSATHSSPSGHQTASGSSKPGAGGGGGLYHLCVDTTSSWATSLPRLTAGVPATASTDPRPRAAVVAGKSGSQPRARFHRCQGLCGTRASRRERERLFSGCRVVSVLRAGCGRSGCSRSNLEGG